MMDTNQPQEHQPSARRILIGVGDMAISTDKDVILSTYALGSCIAVVAFDSIAGVGGILHLMLPDSAISRDRAAKQPALFADTGMDLFIAQLLGMSASPANLRFFVAGGASVLGGTDPYRIGERNARASLEFLDGKGFTVSYAIVGGAVNRSVHLELGSGCLTLRSPDETATYELSC